VVAAVGVWVGRVVARTRAGAVRLVVAARRRRIVIQRTARRRGISAIIVVVPSRRGARAIVITVTTSLSAGAVAATMRGSASVVFAASRRGISATGKGRPRPSAVTTGNVRLSVGNTDDLLTLELAAVELVYGGAKITSGLILDKALAVPVPARLGVNHIAP